MLATLVVIALFVFLTSVAYVGGCKVKGDNGQGDVNQVQVPTDYHLFCQNECLSWCPTQTGLISIPACAHPPRIQMLSDAFSLGFPFPQTTGSIKSAQAYPVNVFLDAADENDESSGP